MTRVVASGPDIFSQALLHLSADATLMALAPGGILPRLDRPPATQLTPAASGAFVLVLELDPFTPLGPNQPGRAALAFEAHTLPGNGRRDIRKIVERIEWLFDGVIWQPCTDSIRNPLKSHWLSTSKGVLPDTTYHTIKYFGMLRVSAQ